MWAVVEIGKKQYVVTKGLKFRAELLDIDEGEVVFDKVLMAVDEDKVKIGTPYLDKAKVKAKIEGQVKGDKVISYTYRRRKKSRVKKGHRQKYSVINITGITA